MNWKQKHPAAMLASILNGTGERPRGVIN